MELFVARQPIFDLSGRVAGYELLYRSSAQSRWADGMDPEQMSRDVIVHSFLEMGLERVTHGKPAFLNFSRGMLLGRSYELLDPQTVVIELLETVDADDQVLAECEHLVEAGYRLALDDFGSGKPHEHLLHLAQIVKVDVLSHSPDQLRALTERLPHRGVRLVAERVETAEVAALCTELGFGLFQGYHFSHPELLAQRGIAAEQLAILELMSLLRDEEVSDQQVEEAFRRDPSMTYRLLRMVNAAAHASRGVQSISHAIRLVGRGPLLRWLALLLVSSLATRGGVDAELVHTAVLRARVCELLAGASGQEEASGSLFITGLFSVMDALLRTPMDQVLGRVALATEVKLALLHRQGPYAGWLRLVEAYEAGQWDDVSRTSSSLGVAPHRVPGIYLESLGWAREQVRLSAA